MRAPALRRALDIGVRLRWWQDHRRPGQASVSERRSGTHTAEYPPFHALPMTRFPTSPWGYGPGLRRDGQWRGHTAILRCRTGAPEVRLSAASMMALASMP